MSRIFGHGRYATVTSTLALVVALSGTAYAAATVTSADIVNGTVQGLDIKTGTVASADIKNNTVASTDILNGTVSGTDIANGSLGLLDHGSGSVDSFAVLDGQLAPADHDSSGLGSAPRLFARVTDAGVLIASAGVTAISHPDPGVYVLTFAQDVASCALVATPNSGNVDRITANTSLGSLLVEVVLADPAGMAIDRDFSLLVLC